MAFIETYTERVIAVSYEVFFAQYIAFIRTPCTVAGFFTGIVSRINRFKRQCFVYKGKLYI